MRPATAFCLAITLTGVAEAGVCGGPASLTSPLPLECAEQIDTDRPHQTDTPNTVPVGHAQIELGLVELATARPGGSEQATITVANNLYKVSVASGVELDLFHGGAQAGRGRRATVERSITVRTKLAIGDVGPLEVTAAPLAMLPFDGRRATTGFVLLSGAGLARDLDAELNLGLLSGHDAAGTYGSVLAAAALTRTVGRGFSLFVEAYTETPLARRGDEILNLDAGVLFRLTRDVQLDWGVYGGLRRTSPPTVSFFGLSTRF